MISASDQAAQGDELMEDLDTPTKVVRAAIVEIDALRAEVSRLRDYLLLLRNHTSVNAHQIEIIDNAMKSGDSP